MEGNEKGSSVCGKGSRVWDGEKERKGGKRGRDVASERRKNKSDGLIRWCVMQVAVGFMGSSWSDLLVPSYVSRIWLPLEGTDCSCRI